MKITKIAIFFLLLIGMSSAFAQTIDKKNPPKASESQPVLDYTIKRPAVLPAVSERQQQLNQLQVDYSKSSNLFFLPKGLTTKSTSDGLPTFIEGEIFTTKTFENVQAANLHYLNAIKSAMKISQPEAEFFEKNITMDESGMTHTRYEQRFQGIKIWNSEIILHTQNNIVKSFNGNYFSTPMLLTTNPVLTNNQAEDIVKNVFPEYAPFSDEVKNIAPKKQIDHELVIYFDNLQPHLAWHVSIYPTLTQRWEYFVDAQDGNVLHSYLNSCHLYHAFDAETCHENHKPTEANQIISAGEQLQLVDGPAVATATDLLGVTRTINTYLHNGNYYLLDASRSMFNAGQSSFPDNPVGGILTLNANNSTTNSLNISHVTSSNNSWNNTKAVSAHYNAGIAFTYFKNTFNRNSINGQGGSIYSIINVRESSSQDMDNAFWNGEAMFYGNGDQAFSHPLARALDVSGHEMSHGVIQSTANLTYQGESGALNESFADIFGAMIDRDDWRMGEDVVNPSVFSSGALRDMQNPHNGGSSLNTPGWQPQHYNERYTGSEDNGGVHINSGIINHAYYMVANNIGKEKAEQIFYRALRDYLTASSKFIDARNAVAQAAAAIHGTNANEVTICNNAFTSVGIGSGQGNNYQQPVQPNPGTEFLLLTESGTNNIYISNGDGSNAQQISNTPTLSRPSITDDGSTVVFVGQDKKMYIINIDWSTGNLQEDLLSEEPVWRNVSISKDGNRIAALTDNLTNQIFVADFTTQQTQTHTYTLYNPTTGQGGVTTSNVRYADVLEFDLSGQHILYDAYNELSNASYWDINVIQVWNNQTHSLTSSGPINKLFNALPDNVSIGNPTYAKNSPFIIAFDYIESGTFGESYAVLGLNLESGNIGEIYTNDDLGVPTYGKADDKVGFYSSGGGNNEFNKRNLASDKITGTGNVTNILTGVKWGTYFANGTRNLVSVNELGRGIQPLQAVPNPATDVVNVYFNADNATKGTLVLYNLLGAEVYRLTVAIAAQRNSYQLALSHLPKGTYFVKLQADNTVATAKIVKQ